MNPFRNWLSIVWPRLLILAGGIIGIGVVGHIIKLARGV